MGAALFYCALPDGSSLLRPDLYLKGYVGQRIILFLDAFNVLLRDGHIWIFGVYVRVFIMTLVKCCRSGLRYFVVGFAKLYAIINLAENVMILRKLNTRDVLVGYIAVAHQLAVDRFASLYLCLLVLIIPLRRSQK